MTAWRIIDRSATFFIRSFRRLLLLAAIVLLPFDVALAFDSSGTVVVSAFALALLAQPVFQAAVALVVRDPDLGVGASLRTALRLAPRLFGATVVFAILLGICLRITSAILEAAGAGDGVALATGIAVSIFVVARWGLYVPAIALDGRSSLQALGRSRSVVHTHIVGVALVVLAATIPTLAVTVVDDVVGGLAGLAAGTVVQLALVPFGAVALAQAYITLAPEADARPARVPLDTHSRNYDYRAPL